MSSSCQPISAAAARSASRLIWPRPGKAVWREDRCTGTQRPGSRQSHTIPLAHASISLCSTTTVGTAG
eukprot:5249928-Pleurochrysis_carterae.AAC.1